MKTTHKWIKELCPADLSAEDLKKILMRVGFEIEAIDEFEDDTVYDLGITANHADWLSAIGIAREVSAVTGIKANLPKVNLVEEDTPIEDLTSVKVEAPDLCPMYMARVIRGVKICESPTWLKRRLELIGLNPVNAVVDITNYIMFETGQPLHAFDMDKLSENRIVVRRAENKEKITAINGKDLELKPDVLVIADAEKPVAIAGVMGGMYSEISDDTTNILLECASFHGPTTRRTTRFVGFTSDSSSRFERGTDLNNAQYVADRTAALFTELCGGKVAKGTINVAVPQPEATVVAVRPSRVNRLLGVTIEKGAMLSALENLGFEIVANKEDSISVKVPSWRKDVFREVDLIEDIARITGYENIPGTLNVDLYLAPIPEKWNRKVRMREIMRGLGYDESITDPFIEPKLAETVRFWKTDELLSLINPIRSDQGTLRTSLLPSLIKVLKGNHDRTVFDVSLFEVSKIYLQSGKDFPTEKHVLGLISDSDFLSIKGVVEEALRAFVPKSQIEYIPQDLDHLESGKSLIIKVDGKQAGYLGQVAKNTAEAIGFKGKAVACEVDFDLIASIKAFALRSFDNSLIPKFPSVERDFAFVLDESVTWAQVEGTIRKACLDAPIEDLKFFDIFRGKQIPKGKKSMALRVIFRSPEGTLKAEALEPVAAKISDLMKSEHGAELRSS